MNYKSSTELKGAAYLLSDKIIIETMNKKDAGTWFSSGHITILPLDVTDIELGKSILNHLSQSKEENASYGQIKEYWKDVIKKGKLKTEKNFFQTAKRVSIKIEGHKIIFEPFKTNISQKMFYRIPDRVIELNEIPSNNEIGKGVRKCWDNCFFIE